MNSSLNLVRALDHLKSDVYSDYFYHYLPLRHSWNDNLFNCNLIKIKNPFSTLSNLMFLMLPSEHSFICK